MSKLKELNFLFSEPQTKKKKFEVNMLFSKISIYI